MKTKRANEVSIYKSLNHINQSFEQILQELECLRQLDGFRKRAPIKSVELAVREVRAWTMFEILDVLQGREEAQWTRIGRMRDGASAPRRRKMPGQS